MKQNEKYTSDQLLDVLAAYLIQIKRSGDLFPEVVIDDIEKSIISILKVNNYNGKYIDLVESEV